MIRLPLALVLLLLGTIANAAGPLSGTWVFRTPEGALTANLMVDGSTLSGNVDVAGTGAVITLSGTMQGPRSASGTAAMASSRGRFEARIEGDDLILTLTDDGAPGKQGAALPLRFTRAGPSAAPTPAAAGDPRLVGTWVSQQVLGSGDASFASEELVVIRADGSFTWGRGRSAAGGNGWSWDGGTGGAPVHGRWRVDGRALYATLAGPDGGWTKVGTYGLTDDGSVLRIIYEGGERKLWTRRQP